MRCDPDNIFPDWSLELCSCYCSVWLLLLLPAVTEHRSGTVLKTRLWRSHLTSWEPAEVGTGTPLYRWNSWSPGRWALLPITPVICDGASFEPRTIWSRISLDSSRPVNRTVTVQSFHQYLSHRSPICFHCSHSIRRKLPRGGGASPAFRLLQLHPRFWGSLPSLWSLKGSTGVKENVKNINLIIE